MSSKSKLEMRRRFLERVPSRTVFWAAGIQGSPVGAMLGGPVDRAGRAIVREDLSVPGHPELFVAGDLAAVKQADGTLVPGVAPAAMQEGRHAARNALRIINGETTAPFRYYNKGDLATIGRISKPAQCPDPVGVCLLHISTRCASHHSG